MTKLNSFNVSPKKSDNLGLHYVTCFYLVGLNMANFQENEYHKKLTFE